MQIPSLNSFKPRTYSLKKKRKKIFHIIMEFESDSKKNSAGFNCTKLSYPHTTKNKKKKWLRSGNVLDDEFS